MEDKIPLELVHDALRLYAQGYAVRAIAAALGQSEDVMRRILSDSTAWETTQKRDRPAHPNALAEELARRYAAGASLEKLAREHHLAAETVRHWLSKRGVEIVNRYGPLPPETVARVLALHDEGATIRDIAAATGMKLPNVTSLLVRHGRRANRRRE